MEDLTPKIKLQGYYEHNYASFLAVLKKNGKKFVSIRRAGSPAEGGAADRVLGIARQVWGLCEGDQADG